MDTTAPATVACDGETRAVDAYLRNCASRTVIDVIANKWTCLLLGALAHGPVRFNELRRRLDGITQKSLTQSLRNLERDGLVTRTLYPTVPPRVEYDLTDLGRSVLVFTDGIRRWSEEHVGQIREARAAYDARAEREPEPVRF